MGDTSTTATPQRLAKRIAAAGLCSRRDAEAWIVDGRVKVDGTLVTDCATQVTRHNSIAIDDNPLPAIARPSLWCYHKPRGLIVSHKDERGRPSIFATLQASHPQLPRLVSVGRLDLDSEGLMLLTNNGALARHLELPATGWIRKYRLRVHATQQAHPLAKVCARLGKGMTIDGIRYHPASASIDRQTNSNAWLTIALRTGKNRELRRMMAHFGYEIARLIRVSFGPFILGKLAAGDISEIPTKVLRAHLPHQLLQAE